MKLRLVLMMCILALLLTGCGYWIVEEPSVQVGSSVYTPSPTPSIQP